ncbi:MAG: hypothetical protein OXB88_03680 [Bacteriovoracales bacterium]|nr:hypothetical protein [Bacteriovoracales bacterium]
MPLLLLLTITLVVFSLRLLSPHHSYDIVIGVPNWPSVRAQAHILKVLIEDNFALKVELQNGTNTVIFEAMHRGKMHVHPEVWLPNHANLHNKFVREKKTVKYSLHEISAKQGMCMTKGTAKRTGLTHLKDLSRPKMAKKFDTNGDGKGEVWIGAPGWASTNVEKVRAKSYGYAKTMKLKEMDEVLALAEVGGAIVKKQNIVFFCYSPHHIFKLYDLVFLKEPPHDPSKWNILQPKEDSDWLQKSYADVAWKKTSLHIHYSVSMERSYPEVANLLGRIDFAAEEISDMTHALVVDKQYPRDFAKAWIAQNAKRVDSWLE